MVKSISSLFVSLLLFLFSFKFVSASVFINEFSSASSPEWVELLNTESGSTVPLTGWSIQNGSGVTLRSLSGFLPKQGMLTFSLDSPLIDAGDCLRLVNSANETIFSVHFGTGSCGGGGQSLTQAPASTQTGALINNSWVIDDTPSKGWCNDTIGGCPTITTITSSMSQSGVTTNLGDQTDYTRTSGLYFEKTGYGRITFLNEINFTDQEALSWMQTLDTKLDLSAKARIGLDADLIKNLVNTQAQLTMYGLTFTNPEVLVDGSLDTNNVISGLSYSGGNLTFTAAHFTTFTAREKTSSNNPSTFGGDNSVGNASPSKCLNQPPSSAPKLFQIITTATSAKLSFAPAKDPIDYYYIAYGLQPAVWQFGTSYSQGHSDGVLEFTINLLKPATKYYFQVRGGNGCMPGPWSEIINAKTKTSLSAQKQNQPAVLGDSTQNGASLIGDFIATHF